MGKNNSYNFWSPVLKDFELYIFKRIEEIFPFTLRWPDCLRAQIFEFIILLVKPPIFALNTKKDIKAKCVAFSKLKINEINARIYKGLYGKYVTYYKNKLSKS